MPEWNGRTEKAWRDRMRITTRHTLPSEMAAKMPMMHLYNVRALPVTATSATHSLCPVAGTACPRQGVQALAPPGRGAYELMGQRHCCDAPAGQYVPAEQLLHDDDPGPEEYLPAVQGVQRVAPTLGEYVPGSHNRGLTSPALGQKLPAGQALHVLLLGAPMESDDVPFGQRSRTLDEALQLELPHGAYPPAGARWHTEVSLEV